MFSILIICKTCGQQKAKSFDYNKIIVVRKKGNKDYTPREKQMMVSLINDYSIFGTSDDEIIKMLSAKIGKENNEKISETLFYRLKKEAVKKRGETGQWLDSYARYQFVEYYRKRMEEIELVQKKLLKALAEETEKENKDKTLISQLSKTIIDTSKLLADYGFAPPLVTKIFDLISKNFSAQRNQGYEDIKRIRMLREHVIGIKLDNEDQYDGNKEDSLTEENDPNAVFGYLLKKSY